MGVVAAGGAAGVILYLTLRKRYSLAIVTTVGGSTDPLPDRYGVLAGGGRTVTVSASPCPGYVFVQWMKNCTAVTDNPITFEVTEDTTLMAIFSSGVLV